MCQSSFMTQGYRGGGVGVSSPRLTISSTWAHHNHYPQITAAPTDNDSCCPFRGATAHRRTAAAPAHISTAHTHTQRLVGQVRGGGTASSPNLPPASRPT
jgi:hypothetical protein